MVLDQWYTFHYVEIGLCTSKEPGDKLRLNNGTNECRQIWMPFGQVQNPQPWFDRLMLFDCQLFLRKVMNVTQIYAITAGAIFSSVLTIRVVISLLRFFRPYSLLLVKHLLYSQVLRRHRFLES